MDGEGRFRRPAPAHFRLEERRGKDGEVLQSPISEHFSPEDFRALHDDTPVKPECIVNVWTRPA